MKHIRVHLTDGDQVDLVPTLTEHEIRAYLEDSIETYDPIIGTHVGGAWCAIPGASVVWVEIIDAPEEDSDG